MSATRPSSTVGSAALSKAKQGTETLPTGPTDPIEYKHVTPTHFIVFQVAAGGANTIAWAHGGTYTLEGGTYTENIQHGLANLTLWWAASRFPSNAQWRAMTPGTTPKTWQECRSLRPGNESARNNRARYNE